MAAAPPRARKSRKPAEDPPEFARFRAAYPQRSGDQRWRAALSHAKQRIAAGHTWAELIAGAERYAAFIRAKGDEGTEYVKQAASFVGTDPKEKPFLLPWTLPASKAQRQQDANLSASETWLREQEAADAA